MTKRAAGMMILFGLSLAGGVITGRDLFFNLSYVWGGLLLASFLISRYSLDGIELERKRLTSRAQVGHLFQERFTVRNRSRLPTLWLDLRDHTDMPGYQATALSVVGVISRSDFVGHSGSSVFTGLRPSDERSFVVRTVCTKRGYFELGPTDMLSGDPFGLFPRSKTIPARDNLLVLPEIVPIHSFPIPTGRLPGGEALRRRTHQITANAAGVRDYEPGDSLNRIHWRSTARRDRLIAKEFEFDPLADAWLLLDASARRQYELERTDDPLIQNGSRKKWHTPGRVFQNSTEEYSVSIAASLAFYFTENDRNVGLIAHGAARHVVQPERAQAQLFRLLESLAVLDASGAHSLLEVIKIEGELIPRGATVIIITADTQTQLVKVVRDLKRMGKMPILLLLDAETFGGPGGSNQVLEAARREGALAKLVRCGDDLSEILSAPFQGSMITSQR